MQKKPSTSSQRVAWCDANHPERRTRLIPKFCGLLLLGFLLPCRLHAAPGDKKWEFQFPVGPIMSSAAIGADGTVYIGLLDKKVYALNGTTGQTKWEFLTGDEVWDSPALGPDGSVYVGSHDVLFMPWTAPRAKKNGRLAVTHRRLGQTAQFM